MITVQVTLFVEFPDGTSHEEVDEILCSDLQTIRGNPTSTLDWQIVYDLKKMEAPMP